MMLITNLLCLGVGVALGIITITRIMAYLGDRGRCELKIIGKNDKLYEIGFIDDKIIDEAIERLNNN